MNKKQPDQFSPEETRNRMESALRGSRISGHKPMSEIAPKRNITKRTKAKKPGK